MTPYLRQCWKFPYQSHSIRKRWTLNSHSKYRIYGRFQNATTLFSKRSAHWFTLVLPVTLGHWPWPRAISILSNGLDSNMQKTPFKNSIRFSRNSRLWHGVFCELLSRPIDKIKMTQGQGQWPRDLRKLGWFSCALLSEKSVHFNYCNFIWQLLQRRIF